MLGFAIAADNNDNVFSLCTPSLSMNINIPKCLFSFALLRTVCIVGDVTSRSLSQTCIFEYLTKNEAKAV